jgi:hypothetical protein
MVASEKGTLPASGPVPARFTNPVGVQYSGQVLEHPLDGLGHGDIQCPSDPSQGAGRLLAEFRGVGHGLITSFQTQKGRPAEMTGRPVGLVFGFRL